MQDLQERVAAYSRKTKETSIEIMMNLDGEGKSNISTGVGFFDHMLNLFSFHSGIDLDAKVTGDLWIDDHHMVEDFGISLGCAIKTALGDKKGINRYGTCYLPMDESLAFVTLDISGRPYLVFEAEFNRDSVGQFSTEMVEEFFRAVAFNAGITLHCKILYGKNDHHKIEALFKGFGRALRDAIAVTNDNIPSTKGVL
ncbi:imidazoleglycerol-phosphate dehydratase [Clostridium sp. TW13]|uniref:Imidazoleglycerol-phosphate dehydratase n=1 Tax=Inconstantimicrobium mannanitabidum TaxID=1604901 RepID=A0ACB5RDS6_9CLOT|nr:imidazoleglycerol-phosphate dehydratase [Clostridium sp. TW13]